MNRLDPSGLLPQHPPFPINQAELNAANPNLERLFLEWYNAERRDMAWLKELLIPPDRLEFQRTRKCIAPPEPANPYGTWGEIYEPVLPEGWEWDSKFAMKVLGYHPNATYGIRSKLPTASGAGQHAMDDKDGKLITGGLSAGTPDKVSPNKSILGHRNADVEPFNWAWTLDKQRGGDKFRKMYLEVRPPLKSPTAPDNIVD
jgi:hypothetical protein